MDIDGVSVNAARNTALGADMQIMHSDFTRNNAVNRRPPRGCDGADKGDTFSDDQTAC